MGAMPGRSDAISPALAGGSGQLRAAAPGENFGLITIDVAAASSGQTNNTRSATTWPLALRPNR